MFTIASILKIFGGKLEKMIDDEDGKLSFHLEEINKYLIKEKVPFKLMVETDMVHQIVISVKKREL